MIKIETVFNFIFMIKKNDGFVDHLIMKFNRNKIRSGDHQTKIGY